MIYIKRKEAAKGIRYYREDMRQERSFPIARVEAERLLANGEAELAEYFCTSNDIAAYDEAQRA